LKILKVKYIGPLILLPLYMLGLVDQKEWFDISEVTI
jgi:hypothetical protein